MAGYGVNSGAVGEILERAGRLDAREAAALADAVGWRWWPLTVPPGGAIAGAWATARATAHRTGRDGAVAQATAAARAAVLDSPGYRAASRRSGAANAGLTLLAVGLGGALLAWLLGWSLGIWVGLLVALAGLAVSLFSEGGLVRTRVLRGLEGAVLAAALRDVLDPDAYETLSGPWRMALRD